MILRQSRPDLRVIRLIQEHKVRKMVPKDFVAPNHLGWITICLLDDGRNIHHQNFSLTQSMLPQHMISQITETENIIIYNGK